MPGANACSAPHTYPQNTMALESASAPRLTLESSTIGGMTVAVLGSPGNDNAVLFTLNSGENITRLLFDCGAGCLDAVRFRELQQIDAVLFSHFHMDHVSGFDTFVRANFAREKPVRLFGPAGSHAILQHRLQGFLWDLVDGNPGRFLVTEVRRDGLVTVEFRSAEGFAISHPVARTPGRSRFLAPAARCRASR